MSIGFKKIQKISGAGGHVEYQVFIRETKFESWIYLGTTPTFNLATGLVRVGRELYFNCS